MLLPHGVNRRKNFSNIVQLNSIRHHSPECSLNATFNKQTNRARIQRSATCSNAAVTPMSLARLKLDASPPTPLPVQIRPPPTQLIALIHLTAAMIGESCSWYTTTRTRTRTRTWLGNPAADIQQLELPALTHFSDKTTSVKTVYSILTKMWSNSPPNLEETSSCIVALRQRIGGCQESENILWISS